MPNLKLTIYGEGPERKNLKNLIEDLAVKDQVSLPGAAENIQDFLIKTDLFIFTSVYEGFPNALCEAMAVGLPVVASNCSGTVDIIRDGENGILFPVGSVEKLYEKMLDLIHNYSKRYMISVHAKQLTELYSEERIYEKWNSLIKNIRKIK